MLRKFINLISRKKRLVIIVLVVTSLVGLFVFYFFTKPVESPIITKPPVVEVSTLEVISADPVGEVKSLNTLFPVSVKFNESLGIDASSIYVGIVPNISFDKYILDSLPNVLWIEPKPVDKAEVYGWVDGVTYTISIRKGSKSVSGAVLDKDYSFSFSNSTEGVSMFAE